MFEKMHRLKILGVGLLATGVLACQQQPQEQAAKPIEFSSAGFEGIEIGKLALLATACDPATDPVIITVGGNEFAYIYLRSTDSKVVVNASTSGGGECAFAPSKKITVTKAGSGKQNRKVLIDFLNGPFSAGTSGPTTGLENPGIAIDLGSDLGTHTVLFRGTVDQDLYTFGTGSGSVSYGAFASSVAPAAAPTSPDHADFSLTGVTVITVSTGPSNDTITGQARLSKPIWNALSGDINLNAYGGEGDDSITSGAAGNGVNSLYGGPGNDTFIQVPGIYAHDVISGGVDPLTTGTITSSNVGTGTTTGTVTDTGTQTQTGTAVGITSTGTGTKTVTTQATDTRTLTNTSTVTAAGTRTRTNTVTNTNTNTATGTATATGTGTTTVTGTVTATNTGTVTATSGDISIDVVDYSAYGEAITVTLGDQNQALPASATIALTDSNGIADYDGFTINDGAGKTRVVEFHKTGKRATGSITAPSGGAGDLATQDTFTIDDGTHAVTFRIIGASGTATTTATDTSVQINVTGKTNGNTAAVAIADGIIAYQMAHRDGTSTGTSTVTDTSIVPNVTVTPPTGTSTSTDVSIGIQNRNAVTLTTMLAKSSTTTLIVANVSGGEDLHNVNGTNTIPVVVDDADADAATVTSALVAALPGSSGLKVGATNSGIVVTVAADTAGARSAFAVTKNSGGLVVTPISTGVTQSLVGNDGKAGELDSIGADVEVVIGTPYDDVIDATYASGNRHILFGMDGNDKLIIGPLCSLPCAISNTLYGGTGDDHLVGGNGDDTLMGGDGSDTMTGGLGNDTIDGDGANCDATYASSVCSPMLALTHTAGVNILDYSDRTDTVIVDLTKLADATAQIGGTSERDIVTNCMNVRGGAGDDIITGDSNGNILWGGPGDDTISGGPGADTIYGDTGNDILSGDAGNDFIFGGPGVNKIYGDTHNSPSVVGINMVDNSEGTKGTVDCGASTMDIFFSDGHETSVISCDIQ
jgi:hypothetical protein